MSEYTGLSIDRREFLLGSAGVCFSFMFPVSAYARNEEATLTAWVKLDSNGNITIVSPAAEMGQGSMTAIPMIFAEELDANWDNVSIEFSPADDAIFKNPTPWVKGIMLTLGSSAVSGYYDSVRLYGAQARKILLTAAAEHWQVPITELTTEPGIVIHKQSSRRIDYGKLATLIKPSAPLPNINESELKSPNDFRIIGSDIPRYDVPVKVNGSPLFSIDIDLPDMVYATVTHSPVNGGKPLTIKNLKQIEARTYILKVITLPNAVAIVAKNYETAYQAEKEIEIEWSQVDKLASYNDSKGLEAHLKLVKDGRVSGMPIQKKGDMENAGRQVKKSYEAEYLSDYLYHAQLEPLNAVANVKPAGDGVDVWAGTQAPTHCLRSVAEELNISPEKVNLHRSYLGGGFGRRGAQDHDYVIDAVQLSRIMKKPVKVIWSRESDVKTGRFKPIKAMRLQAGEDSKGKLISWHHRTASNEALKQSDPYRYGKVGGWPVISSNGMDIDYAIDNVLAEILDPDTGVRAAPLRGIGGTLNKFASESFLDEIATKKGIDPLTFRIQLLEEHEVAIKTLKTVAKMADWTNRGENSGLGLAFDSVYYPTAYIIKVELDKKTNVIQIPKVWVALDLGLAIHPKNIIGQLEGQIIFAISNVLKERITLQNGAVVQSNFYDYPIMRINEIPDIEVEILERRNSKPKGVGDSRLAAIPAAVANGFASLTGKRLRHAPFLPERVAKTLSS